MAGNDTGIPAGSLVERLVIGVLGAASLWAARHWGWKRKKEESSAVREQHYVDVAFKNSGKTIDDLWLLIKDARQETMELRARVRELEIERETEEDRTRSIAKELDAALFEVRKRDQMINLHERTIKNQSDELERFVDRFADQDIEIAELKARATRLEQQVRDSGGYPTNGH